LSYRSQPTGDFSDDPDQQSVFRRDRAPDERRRRRRQGVKREVDTVVRNQAEKSFATRHRQARGVRAVKDMARLAREENEALKARIAVLEAKPAFPPRRRTRQPEDGWVIALSLGWEKLSGSAGYAFKSQAAWDRG